MKLSKTVLFSTLLAASATLALGGKEVKADEVYTVKENDTLSKISMEFVGDNSLVDSIVKDNDIKNADQIFVGEKLTIATDGKAKKVSAKQDVPQAEESAPVYEEQPSAPVQQQTQEVKVSQDSTSAGNSSSAKEWIAQKESGGSYSASNGQYVGRYQLSSSYLSGDYSAANQEKVADQYVSDRYGSWEAAKSFWVANGWY